MPSDLIGLYLGIEEVPNGPDGPPLVWECWDGQGWIEPAVRDETRGLSLPGLAAVLWPGVPQPATAQVSIATGTAVQLASPRDAALFEPGAELYLADQNGQGELVTATGVAAGVVALKVPLSRDYNRATLGPACLPRFGTPRTWLRARLKADGEPPRPRLDGLWPNAVWASQQEIVFQRGPRLGHDSTRPGALFSPGSGAGGRSGRGARALRRRRGR